MKTKFIQLLLWGTVIGQLVFSCARADDLAEQEEVPVLLIDNFSEKNIVDCSNVFSLHHIRIAPSVALKLKTKGFVDFFVADSSIFIVNAPDELSKISFSGDLLWQLASGSKEFNIFNSLGVVTFNSFSNLIEIRDNMSTKMMDFDLEGNFVSQRESGIDFSGRINLSADTEIYGVAPYSNSHLRNDGRHFDLIRVQGKKEYTFMKESPVIPRGRRGFSDLNVFETMDGEIFYQQEFSDTVFTVTNKCISPAFVVHFTDNANAQRILDDPKIIDKVPFILGQNIPFIDEATVNEQYYFILYYSGSFSKMFIADKNGKNLVNCSFIKVEDMILPAPKNYSEGRFIVVLSEQENEFLKRQAMGESPETSTLKAAYKELQSTDTDLGGLHYYMLEVR